MPTGIHEHRTLAREIVGVLLSGNAPCDDARHHRRREPRPRLPPRRNKFAHQYVAELSGINASQVQVGNRGRQAVKLSIIKLGR